MTLARDYATLRALAPRLEQLKIADGAQATDEYIPPTPFGPSPPCSLTWLDYQWVIEDMLDRTAAQVRRDTGNLYGQPVCGIAGTAGWLLGHVDHLATAEWLHDPSWLAEQYQCEPTTDTMASLTHDYAAHLDAALEPPLDGRPAGTALEVAWETGIPVATIRSWGQRGKIPRFAGPQGAWLYRVNDVLSLKSRRLG